MTLARFPFQYTKIVSKKSEIHQKSNSNSNSFFSTQNWESFLNDGLHLSTPGSELLFNLLQPLIDKLVADIPIKFPFWDEVDTKNISTSLVPHRK